MDIRRHVKSYISRAGFTMSQTLDALVAKYMWSDSLSGFSSKLRRGSLRYQDAVEIADVLGYDIIWKKRDEDQSLCLTSLPEATTSPQ